MARIHIGGQEYNLVMTIRAMRAIEEKYGDLKEALEKFRGKNRSLEMIQDMFRIMANAGRHMDKEPEDVTGHEIDDLGLMGLNRLSETMRKAMDESLEAETVDGGPADNEEHDIYAEERERLEKNGKAGGGSGSSNTTDMP